jgi:ABC-type glycerol-3-phosphate transport system permease component
MAFSSARAGRKTLSIGGEEPRIRHGIPYKTIRTVLLITGAVIVLYPLMWMVSTSLKTHEAMYSNMYSILIPKGGWAIENYAIAWRTANIGPTILNSVKITFTSLFFMMLLSYLTSYALVRMRFAGRRFWLTLFVTLMLVPLGQVVMIPQYQLIRALKMNDTLQGVILLYINSGIPFSVFLLTSFISRIPLALDEAAHIDGASRVRIVFQICLPLSLPGFATVIIFQFMTIWNDYFTPLIYLVSPGNRTITLGLKNFSGVYKATAYNQLFAALCIVSIPVIIIFLLFQNLFISSIAAGSVKE